MNTATPPYKRPLIILVASASIFLFGAGLTTLGSVIPELKTKFALDAIGVGAIFSVLPLGILGGSLLFGPIADRFGYRLMLGISCLLICLGLSGIAHAGSLWMLKLAVFCFGTGGGAINGGTSAAVSDISERKGAALSLLGVFFGLGALILPLVFGVAQGHFTNESIITVLSWISFFTAVGIFFIPFPAPKHLSKFPLTEAVGLFKNKLLLLISFFLFCQSSFEGIINNWTTLYLTEYLNLPVEKALFSLSVLMMGITLTRLITGTVFRNVDQQPIIYCSLFLLFAGTLLLHLGGTFPLAAAGLFLMGSGLAGGFPIMLGFVGKKFPDLSGTAFSFVLVIALFGNMVVNYFMGIIGKRYGIVQLVSFCYAEIVLMTIICFFIIRNLNASKTSS
ncbi:MAG: MFS transporter [Chitinophagaceae bacterium]